jgi:hypothetical protein
MLVRKLGWFLLSLGVPLAALAFSGQALADSSTLVGMINNGDVYVKSGSTTAPWTYRLTTGEDATQLHMYGDRVAFVDGNNNLWLKQGLTGQWYEEIGNVQSYALTEDSLLVLQTGGDVWYKSGSSPTGWWDTNMVSSDATQVYLSPHQMAIVDTSGRLLGKVLTPYDGLGAEGPDGDWDQVATNVSSAAISDSMLVYLDTSGNTHAKEGPIWYSWWNNGQVIDARASAVWTSGDWYCATLAISSTNHLLSCKNVNVGGGWEQLAQLYLV